MYLEESSLITLQHEDAQKQHLQEKAPSTAGGLLRKQGWPPLLPERKPDLRPSEDIRN
jgi:hypothetical protein